MTIAERLRQEGMEKGKPEGSVAVVSRLIAKKIHINSDESFARLKALKPEDIMELADHIMETDSYDDIKFWILQKTK